MNLETDEDISAYYRGLLIQKTIDIELRMEIVIGRFLSMDNQERTLDLIEIFDIAIVDFSQKIKILKYIVRKYIPDFLNEKKTLTENREKFFVDLTYIMERRNELAHKKPDIKTNDYLKITWNITKNDKQILKEINLTKEFRKEYGEKCANTYVRLIELETKVCELK
ncbi:hypothetical protein [uncultured Winogradskyella sp.]|uniref:hypothetical protein n=1 Tax=uncultured Winogradskyella sp. TaxID=395353 RepID=UPI0030ED4144|tara:strand:+ start:2416 stop:2916 length:501 start_codon:yes stop_codon:yes gene_type:complete